MAAVKVTLLYPTLDAPAGAEISVDKETADALVANGSATHVASQSKKD